MSIDNMLSFLYLLIAAVVAVPLFRRLKLGSILGYLCAGILIGPACLHLIGDTKDVLHFSELGVVLLLFVIGLELNPEKLWRMRTQITMLGGTQLSLCAVGIAAVVWALGFNQNTSIVIGLALALSSTAFALQLMVEKGIIGFQQGRLGFAILLMQDLAVIPILLLASYLAPIAAGEPINLWLCLGAITALLIVGRYIINPLLDLVARFGSNETMTATALLIVLGSAVLMEKSGLSMGLGAFSAGVLLANSRYRHQLEADIEPFKGLTLGLFFIAIGMTLDIDLLLDKPVALFGLALGLMLLKTAVITVLMLLAKQPLRLALPVALMLSQGGEFAFVIITQSAESGMFEESVADTVNLVVGLSMMLTVPLVAIAQYLTGPGRSNETIDQPDIDAKSEVVILGFGRFGQMTGRILSANHIPFTAIDQDPEHIKFVRQFGNKVFFGDATRLDLLNRAGIRDAQAVIVAIDETEKAVLITRLIRSNIEHIKIIARARNRLHYLSLKEAGADAVIRELYDGSLQAAEEVLGAIGYSTGQAIKTIELFKQHDNKLLERAASHHDDIDKVVEIGKEGRKELEQLFNEDNDHPAN